MLTRIAPKEADTDILCKAKYVIIFLMQILDYISQFSIYGMWVCFAVILYMLVRLMLTAFDLLKSVMGLMGKVNQITEKTGVIQKDMETVKKSFTPDGTFFALGAASLTILSVLKGNKKKHSLSVSSLASAAISQKAKKNDSQRLVESVTSIANIAKSAMK